MKFKLENREPGVMLCHILEPLSKDEGGKIVQGIEKVLANGKARLIVVFSKKAAEGEGGADFLEKSLRNLKVLAKKMGGDIKYVVPDPIGQKVFGAVDSIEAATKSLLGQSEDAGKERETLLADATAKNKEIQSLRQENKDLIQKLEELTKMIRQPSTDDELKKAVDHYRLLAAEAEAASPSGGAAKEAAKGKS